jgi:hypothetical protein
LEIADAVLVIGRWTGRSAGLLPRIAGILRVFNAD